MLQARFHRSTGRRGWRAFLAFALVAPRHRRWIGYRMLCRLALAASFAVVAFLLPGPPAAHALTDCDVPSPPPVCPDTHYPSGRFEEARRQPDGILVRGWA